MHQRGIGREASANSRGKHLTTDSRYQHRNRRFPCTSIDESQRALILQQLRNMRGTLRVDIHGNTLTCIFAPQCRQPLKKLVKRISKILRQARNASLMLATA